MLEHLCQIADCTIVVVAWNSMIPAVKKRELTLNTSEKMLPPGSLDVQGGEVHTREGYVFVFKQMVGHFLRYELVQSLH